MTNKIESPKTSIKQPVNRLTSVNASWVEGLCFESSPKKIPKVRIEVALSAYLSDALKRKKAAKLANKAKIAPFKNWVKLISGFG